MNSFNHYLLLALFLFCTNISYGAKRHERIDSAFRIVGKVVDENTLQPIELVSVHLFANDSTSVPLKSAITNEAGEFELHHDQVPFVLKVSFMGFEAVMKKVEDSAGAIVDVGTIGLKESDNTLGEVTVNAKRPALELITGGYRFNADNNVIGTSTNMAELLKQVPGLTVDELEGKIQLLGKGPTVLINGRKVNMGGRDLLTYLKSLPSNEVLSINVLTNPGAEYDSVGDGGILDIRLKKGTESGFFGSASAGVSSLWGTDESLNLNLKRDKIDISLGYSFSYSENLYRRDDVIKNYSLPDSNYLFLQNQVSDRSQKTHSIKANVVYNIDTTSAISVNYWYAYLFGDNPNRRNADILNRNDVFQRRVRQTDADFLDNDFHILDMVYDKDFGAKSKLSVGLNYSNYDNENTMSFRRHAYNAEDLEINSMENESRDLIVSRPYDIWSLNADFKRKLGGNYEIKLGVKYNSARTKSDFKSFIIEEDRERFLDDNVSNNIEYNEEIKSAYSSLNGKYTHLSFEVGLRLESFDYRLRSHTIDEQVKNDYTNLFPNASVRYESEDRKNSVSLSANRRIERPGYSLLNPFVVNNNIGFVSSGNPNLKPYFTNRLDAQYSHRFSGDHSLIFSVYGSSSENIFSRITRYNAELGSPEVNSYNDYNMKQIGSYLMVQSRFGKKVNVNTYLSVQRPSFRSNSSEDFLLPGVTNFMGNVNLFINVLPKTTVQVLGFYTSSRNSFQTRNGATGYITMGVQQKVLKDKMNISLSCEDIFNTQEMPVSLKSDFLSIESINKLASRYMKLSVSYSFGKSFSSKQSRKLEKESRID